MSNTRKQKSAFKAISSGAKFLADFVDVVDSWVDPKNHPEWYQNYPLDGLTNLNFGRRETIRPSEPDFTVFYERKAPVDAVIEVELTTPVIEGQPRALNEACGIILNQLRSVATTTAQYQLTDVKRYMENTRITMAAYAQLRRLADCLTMADTYDSDAYYKYALMAFPFYTKWKDIRDQKSQLFAALDALTPVLRNLFPARVDVIERMKWLFGNIFIDSPSKKFSTKMIKAEHWIIRDEQNHPHIFMLTSEDGFKIFSEEGEDDVTVDTTTPGVTTFMTATAHVYPATPMGMVDMVRAMIGLLLEDPMASKIAGDLLKAFGQAAFMVIPPFQPSKQAPFIYDDDVLNQIQNLSMAGVVYGYDLDSQTVVWYGDNAVGTFSPRPITTYRDDVSGARAMAMTRLNPSLKQLNVYGGYKIYPYHCGTEVPTQYYYVTSTGDPVTGDQVLIPHPLMKRGAAEAEYAFVANSWSSDDWAPMSDIAPIIGGTVDFNMALKLLDLQNWTLMSDDDQRIFSNIATLSLYCIPFLVQKQDTFAFVN